MRIGDHMLDVDDRAAPLLFHGWRTGADHLVGADEIDGIDVEKVLRAQGFKVVVRGKPRGCGGIDKDVDAPEFLKRGLGAGPAVLIQRNICPDGNRANTLGAALFYNAGCVFMF